MYPEFAETFETDLMHDLTYNLRDGYIDPEEMEDERTSMIVPAVTVPASTPALFAPGQSIIIRRCC